MKWQQIQHWLQQPYPFELRWQKALKNAIITGIFVTLFLFLFKPFGTVVAPGDALPFFLSCLGFGLVTVTVTMLVQGLAYVLPNIFREEKWSLWKEFLFNCFFISMIGLGNMIYAYLRWDIHLTLYNLLQWQFFTFAIGVFPAFFGAFITLNRLNQRYTHEAAQLSAHIHHEQPAETQPLLVHLSGDNQNETLRLSPNDIAYISAADNYVQVYYFEKGILKSKMLRATLKKMEDALVGHNALLRCHRTYIVNMEKVTEVSGNAQGYRLQMEQVPETIPVSRNLNDLVRQKLQ